MRTMLKSLLAAGVAAGLVGALSGPPAEAAHAPTSYSQIVVKINRAAGYHLHDVLSAYPLAIDKALLATRGIYLLRSTSPQYGADPGSTQHLADLVSHSQAVVYAEPNQVTTLDYDQFHAWPDGPPEYLGTNPSAFTGQPAATALDLVDAHTVSTGTGITVAVLDTGVDPRSPVLAGHLVRGWNYVGDNASTADVAQHVDDDGNGVYDQALGHGTFVAGLIALVAPAAKIMPERVLDSDGYGNLFVVAQAVYDAVDRGANVINLSLGTATPLRSHLLADAVQYAHKHNVVIVAAAGNDQNNHPHFPAATKPVLSVSALSASYTSLAPFADYGGWVQVAAPGTSVVGPVPGGGFASWSGTSMATPFVAGEAALLLAHCPTAKANDVINAVDHSSAKLHGLDLAFGSVDIGSGLRALHR